MYTNDELRQMNDAQLFGLLFDIQEKIIQFWRSVPSGKFPREDQALQLAELEIYAMRVAEILIEHGKLPPSWGRQ